MSELDIAVMQCKALLHNPYALERKLARAQNIERAWKQMAAKTAGRLKCQKK